MLRPLTCEGAIAELGCAPGVVDVRLEGSVARGESDQYSDWDLTLTCAPGRLRGLWNEREALLARLGRMRAVVDVSDMVKYSVIGLGEHQRVHLELQCVSGCACAVHEEPPLPNVMSAARFIFWINRWRTALGRRDRLMEIESRLRCLEFRVYADALHEQQPFRGLKGSGKSDALLVSWELGEGLVAVPEAFDLVEAAFRDLQLLLGDSFCLPIEAALAHQLILEMRNGSVVE